jgi:hypothetical protein
MRSLCPKATLTALAGSVAGTAIVPTIGAATAPRPGIDWPLVRTRGQLIAPGTRR